MRLNTTQVERTLSQMNAQVLPDDHPAVAQLTNLFGDHTFFLDENGLKVLEPAGVTKEGVQSSEVAGEVAGEVTGDVAGEVVSLADWTDATLTSLKPHAPEPTGAVIVFREVKH